MCNIKRFIGFMSVVLAFGVLATLFLPDWILLVIMALVAVFVGLCLIKD